MAPVLQKGNQPKTKGVKVSTSFLKPNLLKCAKRVLADLVNPATGHFEIVDENQRKWEFRISQNTRKGEGYLTNESESFFEDSPEYANKHCLLRPRARRRVDRLPATPRGSLTEGTTVNYQKLQELDTGSFGRVWKVLDIDSNELVAVKESEHIEGAAVEAAVMRMVGEHRNVVHLIEAFQRNAEKVSWLVLPLAENTLFYVMRGPLTKWHFCSFTKQIAAGVEHIHGKGLVHCDIKPVNILSYPAEGEEVRCNLKIGDVGSARYEGSSFCGHYLCTRWYRAPEILLGAESSRKPWDIWSVGMVAQELLYQRGPVLQGLNGIDQLKFIFAMNGPCSKKDFDAMVNDGATTYVQMQTLPEWRAEDIAEYQMQCKDMQCSLCPHGEVIAQRCLKYDPKMRCSARSLKEASDKLRSKFA